MKRFFGISKSAASRDERILMYLDGTMEDALRGAFEAELSVDPELQARLEHLKGVSRVLSASRSDSFAPFFSERVMRRLAPTPVGLAADSLYDGLRFVFARTAIAGVLVAGMLAAYNLMTYGDLEFASSLAETLFGLPSASLYDALTYSGY